MIQLGQLQVLSHCATLPKTMLEFVLVSSQGESVETCLAT